MYGQNLDIKTPEEYIAKLEEPRRSEIREIHEFILKNAPSEKPYIQSGMLAYGKYHYKYASGREGDWCRIALASNKNYISIYVSAVEGKEYVAEKYRDKLAKASIGKSCIRYKKFTDIDFESLKWVIQRGIEVSK